jgi:uncharacterized protein (TIGR02217 family)
MSFHDVRFPVEVGQGSRGGAGFKTEVTELDSGAEGRVSFWSAPRHRYDVSYGVRSMEDLAEIKRFYMARQGALNSFRYKDWLDFTTNATNPSHTLSAGVKDQQMLPTTGDNSRTVFQLTKRYISGINTHVRTIALPVEGTIRVWVNGVELTIGSQFNVNYTTGEVTFTTAPGNGQAVEWSGQFDVKVRFDNSADTLLSAAVNGYDLGDIPSIPLVEVADQDSPYSNEYFYGGSSERSLSASVTVDGSAFLWVLTATTTGLSANLPTPTNYQTGGIHWCIQNAGANSIAVKNNFGATLVTLTTNKSCMIVLTVESDQVTKTWYAIGG